MPVKAFRGKVGAVVNAFGIVEVAWSWDHPAHCWRVMSLCPFGCGELVHGYGVPVCYFQLGPDVVHCVVADQVYSVIIPSNLLDAAFFEITS